MAMHRNKTNEIIDNTFAEDVHEGLSSAFKHLPSKYFYDDEGTRLFQKIMALPEYYLTNCESEILQHQSVQIYEALNFNEAFNVVELGAGDGTKTLKMLKTFTQLNLDFTFVPIDISLEAINSLIDKTVKALPNIKIKPMVGDYFEKLKEINADHKPNLILFLGANIGNYAHTEAVDLLSLIRQSIKQDDKLLIGFDLRKNPAIIAPAYSDATGITRAFNLNLLHRINNELKGDFNINQFDFYSHYNPETGAVKSYLVSLVEQKLQLGVLQKTYSFKANELIFTELSKKYNIKEIEEIALKTGFGCQQHFKDKLNYFSDSLLCKR